MSRRSDYIFDLYGTLADILTDERSPKLWRLSALWYSEHGAAYSAAELKERYLALCRAEQEKSPDPLYEIELRSVFAKLFAEKGAEADARLVDETAVFFRLTSLKKLRLYPWVRPVFRRIKEKGSGIYLLSNAQACFTVPELRYLGIIDEFDGIVLSSDAGVKKPSPAIMEKLLSGYGLDPARCMMIGNDQRSDIAVARAFGMDSLYIRTETSGEYAPEPAATYSLTDGDYSKLPGLLGL
ncbi:MAG: HAD family hydrolase [Clostridia bacterium]|nr:HAD family hydrolase [Clostridia bacterium]